MSQNFKDLLQDYTNRAIISFQKNINYEIEGHKNKSSAEGMLYSSNYYRQIAEIIELSQDKMAEELYNNFKVIIEAYPDEATLYGLDNIEQLYKDTLNGTFGYCREVITKEFNQPLSSSFAKFIPDYISRVDQKIKHIINDKGLDFKKLQDSTQSKLGITQEQLNTAVLQAYKNLRDNRGDRIFNLTLDLINLPITKQQLDNISAYLAGKGLIDYEKINDACSKGKITAVGLDYLAMPDRKPDNVSNTNPILQKGLLNFNITHKPENKNTYNITGNQQNGENNQIHINNKDSKGILGTIIKMIKEWFSNGS